MFHLSVEKIYVIQWIDRWRYLCEYVFENRWDEHHHHHHHHRCKGIQASKASIAMFAIVSDSILSYSAQTVATSFSLFFLRSYTFCAIFLNVPNRKSETYSHRFYRTEYIRFNRFLFSCCISFILQFSFYFSLHNQIEERETPEQLRIMLFQ